MYRSFTTPIIGLNLNTSTVSVTHDTSMCGYVNLPSGSVDIQVNSIKFAYYRKFPSGTYDNQYM